MRKYEVEVSPEGTIRWYKWGTKELHNEDGPALIHYNGNQYHYRREQLHNTEGAAVVFANGYKEWWLSGKQLTEKEFNRLMNFPVRKDEIIEVGGQKYKLIKVD